MKTRIRINPTFDIETGTLIGHDGEYWIDEDQIPVKFDRAAVKAAKQAASTAGSTASSYGSQAGTERAPLQAYDIQNLQNPQGIGQQGVHELLTASMGGSGGTSSSLVGAASEAAKRGTTGTSSATLDDIARQRMKATAGGSEGIAAEDVKAKLGQQAEAAKDLSSRYGIDVSAQLGQGKLQDTALNTQIEAGKSGWFQNLMAGITAVSGGAKAMFGAGGAAAPSSTEGYFG